MEPAIYDTSNVNMFQQILGHISTEIVFMCLAKL